MIVDGVLRSLADTIVPEAVWRRRWRNRFESYWMQDPDRKLIEFAAAREAKSGVAVDVGAADGVTSHLLSRLYRCVEAFEPNPANLRKLRITAETNVRIHPVGLADVAGETVLRTPVRNGRRLDGWSSMASEDIAQGPHVANRVGLCRIDDFGFKDVSLLHIDVEGAEDAVLRGAAQLLREQRPAIIIELEERHRDQSVETTVNWLKQRGYAGYYREGDRLRPAHRFNAGKHQAIGAASEYYVRFSQFMRRRQVGRQGF